MLIENIKEAWQNLSGNKMRSLLTMLGIIIGITAVITITTIGNSIKNTLNATMNSLGGNSISAYVDAVYPEDVDWETWVYPEMTEEDYVSQEMLDELQETYPDEVAGFVINSDVGTGNIYKNSDMYANVYVQGCTEIQLDYMKLDLLRGRGITRRDINEKKNVCVVSDVMCSYYFQDENPIGQQVQFNSDNGNTYNFTVVGVYEYNQAVFGQQDTSVPERDRMTYMFVPVTIANEMAGYDASGYEFFSIILQTGADPELAQSEIDSFFADQYADNDEWYIYTYNMSSDMDMIDTVINVITIAISFIAAISLVVGGVGVMNIMLVSITERTKEIGIRKALGAKNRDIRQQFLMESVVLCLIGGIIGILLGILFGFLLGRIAMMFINSYYAEYSSYIVMSVRPSGPAILLSVGFSMLIGIFFGSYPAKKAARMEVIDALRYE